MRRGWHTDIGFDAALLGEAVDADFPGARFIVVGFGERHYVLSRDKTLVEALQALWPGPGLNLMTGLKDSPESAFGPDQVLRFAVTAEQAAAAADFVLRGLSRYQRGTGQFAAPRPYARGPYEGSLFYATTTPYAGFHTCNTWTAEALRAGGIPVRSTGVLFASQVWDQAAELQTARP